MSDLAVQMGARIAAARVAAGLGPYQFSRRLGHSQSLVNRWESGRNCPSAENIVRVAAELGVTVGWLFGEDGDHAAIDGANRYESGA